LKVIQTGLDEVVIIEPNVHGDHRGFFKETWKAGSFGAHGLPTAFAQANVSRSVKGVLRGMHYQFRQPQGKLVAVMEGRIFDVAVDIRPDSRSFGQWAGAELSAENHRQMYIPEGFAHGFLVLSDSALFHYLCTSEYAPEYDAAVAWNDPDIGIKWPQEPRSISEKDRQAPLLRDLPASRLPPGAS
jgi:dTDP-4-dehydrorhamnose 3,5-epimerase